MLWLFLPRQYDGGENHTPYCLSLSRGDKQGSRGSEFLALPSQNISPRDGKIQNLGLPGLDKSCPFLMLEVNLIVL